MGGLRLFPPLERANIVDLACARPQELGEASSQWTSESLAAAAERLRLTRAMHASTVWRILDHAAIKPHRIRYWLHSKDPNFAAKAREIIDLYTNPPPGAVVLSCDEKPGIQAREPFQEWAPDAERRRQARREFHYRRHGTVNLIAALNVRTGEVFGMCADRNRHQEFVAFLEEIVRRHPTGEVHLILDNLATHKHAKVKELIAAQGGRIRLHFTPTHSSWINQIEIWFSTLSRRLLRRGSFSSRDDRCRTRAAASTTLSSPRPSAPRPSCARAAASGAS